jgi:tartrate dehydratase alpha subunit/fumarate hydratase class I-like protein
LGRVVWRGLIGSEALAKVVGYDEDRLGFALGEVGLGGLVVAVDVNVEELSAR